MNVLVLMAVGRGHRGLIEALERHGHNVDVVGDIETASASQIAGTPPLIVLTMGLKPSPSGETFRLFSC